MFQFPQFLTSGPFSVLGLPLGNLITFSHHVSLGSFVWHFQTFLVSEDLDSFETYRHFVKNILQMGFSVVMDTGKEDHSGKDHAYYHITSRLHITNMVLYYWHDINLDNVAAGQRLSDFFTIVLTFFLPFPHHVYHTLKDFREFMFHLLEVEFYLNYLEFFCEIFITYNLHIYCNLCLYEVIIQSTSFCCLNCSNFIWGSYI